MATRTVKTPIGYRSGTLAIAGTPESKSLRASFSSEEPILTYREGMGSFYEILDHSPDAVEMPDERGLPLLLDHETRQIVGKVKPFAIENGRTAGVPQFSRSQKGQEVLADVEDGIRDTVSIGYHVLRYKHEGKRDGLDILRAVKWKPQEVSLVAVPADRTVGVGRSAQNVQETIIENSNPMSEPVNTPAPAAPNIQAVREDAFRAERERITAIDAIARQIGNRVPDIEGRASKAKDNSVSVDAFRAEIFPLIANAQPLPTKVGLGLNENEQRQYSLVRAINAFGTNKWNSGVGIEWDVHQEMERKFPVECQRNGGILVPFEIMYGKRDQLVGTASLGGNLVANELRPDMFISFLRNGLIAGQAGATILTGLTSNVIMPRQSGTGTAYWAASEVASTTESDLTFNQVTLSPNAVTRLTQVGKQTMVQSNPGIEALVRDDINQNLALAIDLAAFHGSGSNGQPTGLAGQSIGSVAGGTHGAAPSWANILELESDVAATNGLAGSVAYVTNPLVRGKLKATYTNATYGEIPVWNNDTMNGYRALASNQIASNLTKGTSTTVCSAIFFGNFADMLIGYFGPGIEIMVDPYTNAATRLVNIYGTAYVDTDIRRTASFSAMLDALTT